MVTSRSVPQQTAQIFSPLAGQKRAALRFSQIGQDTESPKRESGLGRIRSAATKDKIRGTEAAGHFDVSQLFFRTGVLGRRRKFHLPGVRIYQARNLIDFFRVRAARILQKALRSARSCPSR